MNWNLVIASSIGAAAVDGLEYYKSVKADPELYFDFKVFGTRLLVGLCVGVLLAITQSSASE